ncbi:NAD(P)H-dependent oxidoreductase [Propionimicrobium lymphophilum]|uniref:NADPH-dependent FMN reductase-like domain-containing protein n=2 Tax=Propionibacteriaceae TaxID=31957 RepID=S2WI66_9ACTN|nr:NAD(P)H-dependent oxidoreductase [Propionimicrobium lymphophilum]EPD32297.1 hypothetical protein HMPREF9306_01866 [Propionimicrobium lymphophilum ACS-093-V-SCH5]ETJ97014.1 flavin reductase domain protein [Propionimicrobium sp. BV2F7]MDK7709476.1 NAD(P)H-dependent oxidoreductase [Propionimicrobium lymphophilum]MDK7733462.1 NAD(P)H-dependent oxidoreductase [Propionimicrobium lymphophilum]
MRSTTAAPRNKDEVRQPENNRTIPACLKNAVDIGSKPNSDVAWKNKPYGIISHSVGRMGGYSSQKNLQLALSYFDMYHLGQPEFFLGQSPTLLDEDGKIKPQDTVDFVRGYVERFANLVKERPPSRRLILGFSPAYLAACSFLHAALFCYQKESLFL